jgi:hypothetical protein
MSSEGPPDERIESLRSGSTHDLGEWQWLWEGDHEFPQRSHRRGVGGLVVFLKRLFRPLVKAAQSDLWDRQRVFNLIVLGHLEELRDGHQRLDAGLVRIGQELQQVQRELVGDLRSVQQDHVRDAERLSDRLREIEEQIRESRKDVLRHHDALFARLDQKMDRLKRSRDGGGSGASRP